MKRTLHKKISNSDLWEKKYIIRNHGGYKKEKQESNKYLRRFNRKIDKEKE